eukprot:1158293-Pelagomonas_calceolata.AAC.17
MNKGVLAQCCTRATAGCPGGIANRLKLLVQGRTLLCTSSHATISHASRAAVRQHEAQNRGSVHAARQIVLTSSN